MTQADAAHNSRTTTPSAPVRVRGLRKTYALAATSVEALRGLDLEIDQPGFHAIMGPSGSGKSTLLHLLAALDQPDSGEIEVAGVRIDKLNETQRTDFRRRDIGIVFQRFNLMPTMTALDNVTLPAMFDGHSKPERDERGMELLESLGMAQRAHHRPDALSGGEQQRVAIARALYFHPAVLLADEPTGSLDSHTSRQMWELLGEIAQARGTTVVMVTHEPEAAAHCQRVYLLRDGRIELTLETGGLDAGQLATRIQHADG